MVSILGLKEKRRFVRHLGLKQTGIDWNRLNKQQKECLKMMFVEVKWIYNYIISQEDIKSIEIFMQQIT